MRPSRLRRPSRHTSVAQPFSLLLARPGAGLLLSALLIGACCVAGCQSKQGTAGAGRAGAPDDRVPVQPAWQNFVDDNFYGVVQAGLPSRSMISAKFPRKPTVIASRGKDGKIDLFAIGDVDATSPGGTRMRYPASVIWRQRGSGWEMVHRDIGAGAAAPAPPATGPAPAIVPTTRPAAPAGAP